MLTPNRTEHQIWLAELTAIPTAAGREFRVVEWIRRWAAVRPDLALTTDASGNLHIAFVNAGPTPPGGSGAPIYLEAHLDHPAFVVERIIGPGTLQLAFRGGVMDDYFKNGRIVVHTRDNERFPATLTGRPDTGCAVFKSYLADLDADEAEGIRPGDVATWELQGPEISEGLFYTPACDDLAAVAAALSAFDTLRAVRAASEPTEDVRLLFTRAEEIGFVGAIAACKHGTIPKNARVLALENSRAFEDSPIGGGPIVRVGDRLSTFSPTLTAAVAQRAEEIAGGPATPTAAQKQAEMPSWKWQRKLMAGGACEATVFCAAGYEATCLCLPLGNYHNMTDLAAVQAGTNTNPPKVGREFIGLGDYHGLVDLLIACGQRLPSAPSVSERIERLWNERSFVLDEPGGA